MRKSKSWIKSLLIIVLAMLMVFTLVACNNDDDDGNDPNPSQPTTPTPSPEVQTKPSEFFSTLWNVTKPIGATAIDDNADLSLEFGMELSLETVRSGSIVAQQVDFGIDVQAVLGRTESTKGNTAIKVRIYDPTNANQAEIVTLYAFAQDLDNVYVDFAGKNVKVPHNLVSLIWDEIYGNKGENGGDMILNLLNNDGGLISMNGQTTTINNIINDFTGDFGANWTLNSVIDRILGIVNIDLVGIMEENNTVKGILGLLGIKNTDDLLDENGKLDIHGILTGNIAGMLFTSNKKDINGVTQHKAMVQTNLFSMLSNIVGDLGTAIGNGEISLMFNEKDGAIQDFTLRIMLGGLTGKNPSDIASYDVSPALTLKINKLKIQSHSEDTRVQLKEDAEKYTTEIALNEQFTVEARGIQIEKIEGLTNDKIYLNGQVIVGVTGMLDIVNTENNKTKLNITVDTKDFADETGKTTRLATASYANGKIAVEFASAIDLGADLGGLTKGLVYDLGDGFNVASWVQNSIKQFFYKMNPELDPDYVKPPVDPPTSGTDPTEPTEPTEPDTDPTEPTEPDPTPEPEPAKPSFKDIINNFVGKATQIAKTVIPMITTDNDLNVKTDNILQSIVTFKEIFWPAGKDEVAWTLANRQTAIVKALLNPPLTDDETVTTCMNTIMEKAELLMNDIKDMTNPKELFENANFIAIKDSALRFLYICAQSVRIDGVNTETLDNKFAGANTNLAVGDDQIIYVNNILAVLGTQITVHGDLKDGIHSSITFKIADASISLTSAFNLIDVVETGDNATFVDVYEKNKTDIANKNQWVILNELNSQG